MDRVLQQEGYPVVTKATVDGIPVFLGLRMARIADVHMPVVWTEAQEKSFGAWWQRQGRTLDMPADHYDLRGAFTAGFRGLDAEGRPVFLRTNGKFRVGTREEMNVFRVKW